jgi:hypothetical protein
MHKNRFSIVLLALALTAVSAGCAAAPLNDTTIAHLFYEADLQAWSVRLYDLTTAESRRMIR